MPKKGFHNPAGKEYTEVNVDRIQLLIDTGRLDPSKPITLKSFVDAGINVSLDGLKVLGGGKAHLRQPIELQATRFTKGAIQAIEAVGGRVLAVYHSQEAIRQLRNPARFAKKHPELALLPFEPPTGLRERLFYASEKARGYLAPGMTVSAEFKKVYQLP
jgi:large subunit ribosomal protein L15